MNLFNTSGAVLLLKREESRAPAMDLVAGARSLAKRLSAVLAHLYHLSSTPAPRV